MIPIIADTHTHTIANKHAYSTLSENAAAAAAKGLRFMCMTEHAPAANGAPDQLHFSNLSILPRFLNGVMLLRGAELNILDYQGTLDLPDKLLGRLEWVIASMHVVCMEPSTVKDHTSCWINIANNPLVDVVGHCGDGRYPFEQRRVVQEFAATGKIVEINAHSFSVRPDSAENCRSVALLCAEFGVPVVVSSDAHFHTCIGSFDRALRMLEEIAFPAELILNADYERFLSVARRTSGRLLTDEI